MLTALALAIATIFAPVAVPDQTLGYDACVTEDQNGCFWDADAQGNGQGQSFTALPDGTVIFWTN